MDFEHELAWQRMTTILASEKPLREAWDEFVDDHEQRVLKPYWAQLRSLKIEQEQADVISWLQKILTDEPIPESVSALWIGLFKWENEGQEVPTIYLCGAEDYDIEHVEWASEPTYLPETRYAQPDVLLEMDAILKTDKQNYSYLDWIFPLAYCAFTFKEVISSKLDRSLFLRTKIPFHVVVGYDNGDFIELPALKS